jgi:hypothetical protein
VVGIVLIIFQSGAVSARQGVFVRDYVGYNSKLVVTLEQPEVARTFYGELKGLGRPALFSFKANKGFLFSTRIQIPCLEGLEDYRPALALFGPDLPKPTGEQLEGLPFTIPAEEGMVISEEVVKPSVPPPPLPEYNEPFTQSNFWEGQEILREIPQDGTYTLVVFSRIGQGGKYALQIGDKANAGLKEILGFPVLWSRIHLWFGDWVTTVLVWLGPGLLAFYGFYRIIRHFLKLSGKRKAARIEKKFAH